MKRILMVLSSHEELGNTGKKTGFYLSEATHAYNVFTNNGFPVDMVSTEGGAAPVDGKDLNDEVNRRYWDDETFRHKIANTFKAEDIDASKYDVIYFAGGHGTMWDFPDNPYLNSLAANIYENGGVVSAVCHGPAALVNVTLTDGSYLVEDKTVSAFTNEEEEAAGLTDVVPFLLEDRLKDRGANIDKASTMQEKVSVDGRLVTGQNPASATKVALKVVDLIMD
ncbi:type 1 glutamine amidotransferase domain-containing protein [Robertkochia aurantiaca]|uniref:type 1 glutamine amidotransferase domain-containing protein n=1 Tax=Robertkochia aurantiaca TaxID=2873700 RepID=UPI001CC942A7|nr:type 1 glutamine amidotransferase domain-containing protein [Robertkochia sp. 3YJGBD-33]